LVHWFGFGLSTGFFFIVRLSTIGPSIVHSLLAFLVVRLAQLVWASRWVGSLASLGLGHWSTNFIGHYYTNCPSHHWVRQYTTNICFVCPLIVQYFVCLSVFSVNISLVIGLVISHWSGLHSSLSICHWSLGQLSFIIIIVRLVQ